MNTDLSGFIQISQSTLSDGAYLYSFTKITDDNGCVVKLDQTHGFFVSPLDYSIDAYGALTAIVNNHSDFETDGIIDATQIIESSAQVDYDSGIEINLLPGFEIKNGAVFLAFIDGCNEGAGGLNIIENDNSTK